ncbi:hypothetical protein NGRA_1546 [Nosema granulosis]|uniref:Uncharacterized protein n=1 Tax=Nosema granulosis TaxID=83296 RepID=A0A9P6GYB8_9MICR|nr:hypothetical protein NGRA_1546 [Nosema granulosis]
MQLVFNICFFMSRALSVPAHKIYMSALYEEKLSSNRSEFLYEKNRLELSYIKLPKSLVDFKVDKGDFILDKEQNVIRAIFKYETLNEFKSSTKNSGAGLCQMEQEFDLDYDGRNAKYRILTEFEFLEGIDRKFKLKRKVKRAEFYVRGIQVLLEDDEITCNIVNEKTKRYMNLFRFMFMKRYKCEAKTIPLYLNDTQVVNYKQERLIKHIMDNLKSLTSNNIHCNKKVEDEDVKVIYFVYVNARKGYRSKINSAYNEMLYLRNIEDSSVFMFHCVCIDFEHGPDGKRYSYISELKDLQIHCHDLSGEERIYSRLCYVVIGNKVCIKIEPLLCVKTCFISIVSRKEVILEVPVRQFLNTYEASINK